MPNNLPSTLPWTTSPLIINAPMGGHAGADLALAVTKARGLGMIGSIFAPQLRNELQHAKDHLTSHPGLKQSNGTLPLGVGLLLFVLKSEDAMPILEEYKPAVVWLFAGNSLADYTVWTEAIRKASPNSQIWIQCGSVTSAIHIAKTARPNVLALQGADAGGHGFERSAGIISLVPEVSDALREAGYGDIPLVAAGGIADGRGVAAALALGAQGAVLGTRFLAARETVVHDKYREAILELKDGGQSTVRSKLFDELKGPNIWPGEYDGRSVVMESWTDHTAGVSLEEIRRLHKEAAEGVDAGYGVQGRTAMWAGTGVGLVKEVKGAGDIVEEVRSDAVEALRRVSQAI